MNSKTITSSTSVDLTGIGQKLFRERLRSALEDMETDVSESESFWPHFLGTGPVEEASKQMLVIADLARVIRTFLSDDVHRWTTSVRRSLPYFVAFVRTERDKRYAAMVDDVLRASDMRLNVCNDASDWKMVSQCLSAAVRSLRPDGVIDVRYLSSLDGFWTQFGDGFVGILTWAALGIDDARESLIPESATIGRTGTTLELWTKDGGLFEIDGAAARGVVDQEYANIIAEEATESADTLGGRLRAVRRSVGLTQEELGGRSGLDQAVVSRIERGKVRPRIDTLRRLADAMGMTVSELLVSH